MDLHAVPKFGPLCFLLHITSPLVLLPVTHWFLSSEEGSVLLTVPYLSCDESSIQGDYPNTHCPP